MSDQIKTRSQTPTPGSNEAYFQELFGPDYITRILNMAQSERESFSRVALVLNEEEEAALLAQSQDLHQLVEQIQKYCQQKLNRVTTTQVRNIFELILQNGNQFQRLPFLRPRIAYYAAKVEEAVGGNKNKETAQEQIELFAYLLDGLITGVTDDERLEGLRLFLESVVAYHRAVIEKQKQEEDKNRNNRGGRGSKGQGKGKGGGHGKGPGKGGKRIINLNTNKENKQK